MSYILDALRKSEAARRSREAPDLLRQTAAPLPPMPADRAPKYAARPAWAVAALGLSALAVALWLRFAPGAQDTRRADPDTPGTSLQPPAIAADPTVDAGAVDDSSFRDGGGSAALDSELHSAPSLDPGRPPGIIPGMPPDMTPGMAPANAPAAAPAPLPRAPSATAPAVAAPAPAPVDDVRGIPSAAPTVSAPSRAQPTADASASALPADGRPVALADIAPDLRRQLPPLRMSMHLWSEAPERRLLVLDGQRLRQGDVIGEVVVERIDRDGAVLAWRGARILLPTE